MCPDEGQCNGGYLPLKPRSEYWRFSKDSIELFNCYNKPEACLVYLYNDYNNNNNNFNFFILFREVISVWRVMWVFCVNSVIS